jgi:hypothetical protein
VSRFSGLSHCSGDPFVALVTQGIKKVPTLSWKERATFTRIGMRKLSTLSARGCFRHRLVDLPEARQLQRCKIKPARKIDCYSLNEIFEEKAKT